ncbi:Calreticulin family-domain-containing protein [Mycotypha africana]|uniref:Calreticulin family-domain-containing protein n=1 Tax=Mycotypha africana TaxID=64632 RepID=UPI0022FFE294|nr:Calreticulin family-domain-containing protein [Mycotypha africana]KAI8970100.1 Calreticulin family-domain-containing protein [Mycotypha africana]
MKVPTIAAILGLATFASAEIFFHETFSDGEGWKNRWDVSEYREDLGKLEVSPGKWYADEEKNVGLRTAEDYRFYAVSSKLSKPFSNKDKDLVLQFDVKNEQKIDCGGSYLKFFGKEFDAKTFNGETDYNIMFGPDICGPKAMVHAIFNYNGTNHNLKKTVDAPKDELTHTYTLIVKPDQTYKILIDGKKKADGNLIEDWDFLPPKKILDPNAKKPEDWVDEAEIVDETDVKPEGYDDIPEYIPDPDAKKPEDWDDDMDGEWEAPSIANPEYKGPWTPRMIPNPAYKGEWVHPEIDNPEYKVDNDIYAYEFGNVGIDVWQVKSGTIFDNILITDDIKEAEKLQAETKSLRSFEEAAQAKYNEKVDEEAKAKAESEGKEPVVEDIDDDLDLEKVEPVINFNDDIPEKAKEALEKATEEEKSKEKEKESQKADAEAETKKPVKDEL